MSRPDFVQFTLDTLGGWSTANYDPEPTLIDQRDSDVQGSTRRSRSYDLSSGNVITVGSQPTVTNEPIGTGYDLRYVAPVTVRCEGLIASEHGDVTDAADWEAFITEAKRLINAERVNPTTDDLCRWLLVEDEADQSSAHRDYFRTDLTVAFHGYEDL